MVMYWLAFSDAPCQTMEDSQVNDSELFHGYNTGAITVSGLRLINPTI